MEDVSRGGYAILKSLYNGDTRQVNYKDISDRVLSQYHELSRLSMVEMHDDLIDVFLGEKPSSEGFDVSITEHGRTYVELRKVSNSRFQITLTISIIALAVSIVSLLQK